MPTTNKRIGSLWESVTRDYINEHSEYYNVQRMPAGATRDRGDLHGVPGWLLECKDQRTVVLGMWSDEAAAKCVDHGIPNYAIIHKRKRAGVAKGYVTIPLSIAVRELWVPKMHSSTGSPNTDSSRSMGN